MRRCFRALLNGLAVLSLLLCAAVIWLWVRSAGATEEWVWMDPNPPTAWPCPRIPLLGEGPVSAGAWGFRAVFLTRGTIWFADAVYVTSDAAPRPPYWLGRDAAVHRRPAPLA